MPVALAAVYIVMLKPGVPAAPVARQHAARFHGRVVHVFPPIHGYAIELPTLAAAKRIAKDPRVLVVERDKTLSIDPPHMGS
jgi:hypothetical protein